MQAVSSDASVAVARSVLVDLALQGGGSHGFSGASSTGLEETWLRIDGISGVGWRHERRGAGRWL
jgi:hypothetical protein